MRALVAVVLVAAVPAGARADGAGAAPVIGGSDAPRGAWPDVAAVLFGREQGCTGTLIAPTVVLTAGHCLDDALTGVLIGASSLARPGEGETIAVARQIEYPRSQQSEDLLLLVLARPSKLPPRRIATGWARFDIRDGAAVHLVGFGATDPRAMEFTDALQQATTTITDADCSDMPGCLPSVMPAGELGAGGMGIDTCPGDSGGPLYLDTGYGTFLAGVTSRSYDGARTACQDGGIYARPDKVIDELEQLAGVALARGPEPRFERLIVPAPGDGDDMRIAVNDPRSDSHRFELTTPPARGAANLRRDGAVRVCSDPAAGPGDDSLVVTVIDDDDPTRAIGLVIPITIEPGTPEPGDPAAPCDIEAFSFPEDSGCCDSGRAGGSLPLSLLVLLAIRRRRR